jgi:hypothetical protein
VAHATIQGDGDTWQEILAVAVKETTAPNTTKISSFSKKDQVGDEQLIIRSYFQNTRSGKRVWDEPPSGASHVVAATEEMHRMAQVQLQELQIVTGITSPTTNTTKSNGDSGSAPSNGNGKKRGFLFGFGKKNSNPTDSTATSSARMIRYKPGSSLLTPRPGGKYPSKRGPSPGTVDQGEDIFLQQAIAQSLAEQQGFCYDDSNNSSNNNNPFTTPHNGDDDELELVKALSLSTMVHNNMSPNNNNNNNNNNKDIQTEEDEEQVLARVLEESKLELAMQHRGVPRSNRSPIPTTTTTTTARKNHHNHSASQAIDDDDCKMPAKPSSRTNKFTHPSSARNATTITPSYYTMGATTTAPMSSNSSVPYASAAATTTQASFLESSSSPAAASVPSRHQYVGKRTSQKVKDQAGLV